MLNKIAILKTLLFVLSVFTLGVIWFFASITSQNNTQSSQGITLTQSSVKVKSTTSTIISSSTLSSSSIVISSNSFSKSSVSSSTSSLAFPILENNVEIINDIKLTIDKPNPEIQAIIKAAKNRPKVEIKSSVSQSSSSSLG